MLQRSPNTTNRSVTSACSIRFVISYALASACAGAAVAVSNQKVALTEVGTTAQESPPIFCVLSLL
jgi:hypothetical protein